MSLGPGVITGAADDDPSGIATDSVVGAQLGTKLLWTAFLTWPLMARGSNGGDHVSCRLRAGYRRPIARTVQFGPADHSFRAYAVSIEAMSPRSEGRYLPLGKKTLEYEPYHQQADTQIA